MTVSVSDDGGQTTTLRGAVVVFDALTGVTAVGATVGIASALPAMLIGATFTDANLGGTLGDFRITSVGRGDGSSDATGLTISGANGATSSARVDRDARPLARPSDDRGRRIRS